MAKPINFTLAPWQHWSKIKPKIVALTSDEGDLTWRELEECVAQKASNVAWQKAPFALISEPSNHLEVLITLLAAWQQGIATLLLNPSLKPDTIAKILQRTGIEMLNVNSSAVSTIASHFDLQAPLSLTLTSGSTGTPKAVVHNAAQHLHSAAGLFELMPFSEQDCWLLSLPLYHISGLAIVWRWLAKGAKLKVANYSGEALLSAIEGVSHASLVPRQLQCILESKHAFSTLHSVLLGGSAINEHLVKQAELRGIACYCGYGMTEMASTISAKRANGSPGVGKALAFRRLMLARDNQILVKGHTLALGYFVQGKLIPLTHDWFATKDSGILDKNNELIILGRMDNMFISGGENIQPENIENRLSQFPDAGQVIILPMKHKKWGKVPVALVENAINHTQLQAFAKTQLARFEMPHHVLTIPKNFFESGIKLSRAHLADWLAKMPLDEK